MRVAKSESRIKAGTNGNSGTNGHVEPGVSLRMGPVEDEMDVDKPANGNKRKASTGNRKSYKESSGSEDDVPLVC